MSYGVSKEILVTICIVERKQCFLAVWHPEELFCCVCVRREVAEVCVCVKWCVGSDVY